MSASVISGAARDGYPSSPSTLQQKKTVAICAASAPKCPVTLSHLKQIPVRILESRCVPPGEVEDLGWLELHASRFQGLECGLAILHLDGIKRGTRLGRARCAWPQNELEVLPFDADRQESRSVGCRVITPLLKADNVRIKLERPVLVAHQQRHVHHFFQHPRSSSLHRVFLRSTVQRLHAGSRPSCCRRASLALSE